MEVLGDLVTECCFYGHMLADLFGDLFGNDPARSYYNSYSYLLGIPRGL